MASSTGRSLSYSRASAEDDGEESNVSRSRSGDDRDQRQQARKALQPDPKETKEYMEAASRERKLYDDNVRRQQSQRLDGDAGTRPAPFYPTSRSPSTSHRGAIPETFRIDTPPAQSGRLRATPSSSPRPPSTPGTPFVMVEAERSKTNALPRPSSRSRASASELLRQVETMADDMSDDQRAQIMKILAKDTHEVITSQERVQAERHYAESQAQARSLQDQCDAMRDLDREKTRRMEGVINANATLSDAVTDMRTEVKVMKRECDFANQRSHLTLVAESAVQATLRTTEHELERTMERGRGLEASFHHQEQVILQFQQALSFNL